MSRDEIPDPILRVAEAERDHVATLLERHQRKCRQPGCPDCVSLAGHMERTERQVADLLGTEAEEVPLW